MSPTDARVSWIRTLVVEPVDPVDTRALVVTS